ncbi:MAG: class I SAM-dependent methyltransferase [Chitinophagales bacterium]
MDTGVLSRKENRLIVRWYSIFNSLNSIFSYNVKFLNLGYSSILETEREMLRPEDKTNDLTERQTLLYLLLLKNMDTQPKHVAEIGCGVGGGAGVLNKYYYPLSYTGFDANQQFIQKCTVEKGNEKTTFHQLDCIRFIELNRTYDAIICLEASLHFDDIEIFFSNVSASLKTNGRFYYGDIFRNDNADNTESILKKKGLKLVNRRDITENVIRSISATGSASSFQRMLHRIFLDKGNLTFNVDSSMFRKLQNGELTYLLYEFSK